MPRYLHPDIAERLAIKALANGGRMREGTGSLRWVEWNIAPFCASTVTVELVSRPELRNAKWSVVPRDGKPLVITMDTECRKCEPCLRKRGARWRYRILNEAAVSVRTWLGTLTFRPEVHARNLAAVRVPLARQGVDYDKLSDVERFKLLERECYKEFDLFIKRTRKNSGTGPRGLRYFLACEPHKSGYPHYHVLLHECGELPVRHRVLKGAWRAGFSDFKLVEDTRQLTYPAKYLTKELAARVRASQDYGNAGLPQDAERYPRVGREGLLSKTMTTKSQPDFSAGPSMGPAEKTEGVGADLNGVVTDGTI